jgi:L-aminopeptidase/D-esterase-like protein
MPIAPVRPGPLNLITDVAGITVGNAEDPRVRSGVTVLLADRPAVAAVDVRGGAPGTAETDALDLTCIAGGRIEALTLSGGSAFGLEAASGVRAWLARAGRGLAFGGTVVPVVPTAILSTSPMAATRHGATSRPIAGWRCGPAMPPTARSGWATPAPAWAPGPDS